MNRQNASSHHIGLSKVFPFISYDKLLLPHLTDLRFIKFNSQTAKPSEDLGPLINIAEDGEATQSSVGWGGVADRAIDGNINMEYSKYAHLILFNKALL